MPKREERPWRGEFAGSLSGLILEVREEDILSM
jgi:hypothetical protein